MTTPDTKASAPTSEELAALIEADKRSREEAAGAAIRAVLEQYRVALVGTVHIVGDSVETGVMVRAQ